MAAVSKTAIPKRRAGYTVPKSSDEVLERLAHSGGVRSQRRRASARRLEAAFAEADREDQDAHVSRADRAYGNRLAR